MSGFSHLADLARTAVEAVHGEPVTVQPMDRAGPNSKPAISTKRPAFSVIAAFYEDSSPRPAMAQPSFDGGRSLHRAPGLAASIRLSSSVHLQTTDHLIRGDGRRYEISEINPDGLGGAMLTLSRLATVPRSEGEDAGS